MKKKHTKTLKSNIQKKHKKKTTHRSVLMDKHGNVMPWIEVIRNQMETYSEVSET